MTKKSQFLIDLNW